MIWMLWDVFGDVYFLLLLLFTLFSHKKVLTWSDIHRDNIQIFELQTCGSKIEQALIIFNVLEFIFILKFPTKMVSTVVQMVEGDWKVRAANPDSVKCRLLLCPWSTPLWVAGGGQRIPWCSCASVDLPQGNYGYKHFHHQHEMNGNIPHLNLWGTLGLKVWKWKPIPFSFFLYELKYWMWLAQIFPRRPHSIIDYIMYLHLNLTYYLPLIMFINPFISHCDAQRGVAFAPCPTSRHAPGMIMLPLWLLTFSKHVF